MIQSIWLARDEDGTLTLFPKKPIRVVSGWWDIDPEAETNFIYIDPTYFPNLKWEDEPIEVNIFTKEFVQSFGNACYEQGQNDACRNEYGKSEEGNLDIDDFIKQHIMI